MSDTAVIDEEVVAPEEATTAHEVVHASSVSAKGTAFIGLHEGLVLNRYLDPVGIPTIGYGFTLLNPVVKEYFGGKLPRGLRMTKEEANDLLKKILDTNISPAVEINMPGANQHEFDAGASISYNVGPRVLKWKWAQAWRAGKKDKAATLMRTTATTARGKRLAGLVRRRREEALVLSKGVYTGVSSQPSIAPSPTEQKPDPIVREYQEKLRKLGYDPGKIDGWMGPSTETSIKDFQEDDPNLANDGILGRATRESIDRRLRNRSTKRTFSWTGITGIFSTIATFFTEPTFITYVAVGAVLIVGGYLLWRSRHLVEAKFREVLA